MGVVNNVTANAFESFLSTSGIAHQISCPYTTQQNDLVERKHRHLIETTITMLSQSSLPTQFWSYALQTALYLINLFPTSVLNFVSLWTKLFGYFPYLSQLKILGCACYPYISDHIPNINWTIELKSVYSHLKVICTMSLSPKLFTPLDMFSSMSPEFHLFPLTILPSLLILLPQIQHDFPIYYIPTFYQSTICIRSISR